MVDIGTLTEVVNATEVRLFLTTTSNQYVLLQEIDLVIQREEYVEPVAIGNAYFYGQFDNAFDATILLSNEDLGIFIDSVSLTNGALTTNTYLIQLTSKDATTKTISVTAITPRLELEKLPEGGVKLRVRYRINEEVTSTDVT